MLYSNILITPKKTAGKGRRTQNQWFYEEASINGGIKSHLINNYIDCKWPLILKNG